MVARNHENRSEKMKGHTPSSGETAREDNPAAQGHQGAEGGARSRSGVDRTNDGKSPQNGGGDGAGGAPRQQGQGQANKDDPGHKQNRGHS